MEGQSFSFGSIEMRKVMKGAVVAVVGSLVAYLLKDVIPMFQGTSYSVLIPIVSVLVNIIRVWVADSSQGGWSPISYSRKG